MTMLKSLPELDYRWLDRELDKVKTRVFLGKASFLGPLQCSLNFIWSTEIQTAATNGVWVKWNPYYFYYLSPAGRELILIHEDWHVALMHMLRRGTRIPKIWNYACDTVLDNMMDLEGYCVDSSLFPPELFPPGCKTFVNHEKYGTMSAEEIYDDMIKNAVQPPPEYGDGDLVEEAGVEHTIVNQVVAASHACSLAGGKLPGEIQTTLDKFLAPKLPWERILHNFFNDLANQDYSWARPNRRYTHMYLPSLMDDHEGLEHIAYFEDVSGSITEADSIRFNSEFKYVKERFEPEKMTLIQFDTVIQKEEVFLKDDPFDEVRIVGGGGTCLICVRDWIIKNQPTAVVIFSDLYVTPMEPLPQGMNIPIIWVAINNQRAKVNMGQLVHLND